MTRTLASVDPATGAEVGRVEVTPVDQLPAIIARARDALPAWRALGPEGRAARLLGAAGPMERQAERLGALITREMGKPLAEAVAEVRSCARGMEVELAEMADALRPTELSDVRSRTMVHRDPFGVCAAITPWNFPFSMPHWMVLPALMAGNVVVFKPSELTPLTGQGYADLLQAVLPPGVLQVVHGDEAQGRALVASEVDLVAFTGSRDAGRDILAKASERLTRVILELGGKDPLVVLSDADVDAAARFAVRNGFRNAGQVCVSTELVLVDARIADAFEAAMTVHAREVTVGSPLDPDVRMGPLVRAEHRARVARQVAAAIEAGARVLFGADDLDRGGAFLNPIALVDVPEGCALLTEETFGPVVCVRRFTTDDEAVRLANASVYGLGAVVFGGDLDRATAVARRLDAGMVGVNRGVGGAHGAPWVGAKQSGYGFHSGREGHRQFAQLRILTVPL